MGAGETDRGKQGRQRQVRPMGDSEAGGGNRDRWGQARLVGAGEANGGRKPPGQTSSQQAGRSRPDLWGQARPMGAESHWPHARARLHETLVTPPGQIPSQHRNHDVSQYHALNLIFNAPTETRSHDASPPWC